MKKSLKIIFVLLVSLLFSSYTFAATVNKDKTTLSLVEDNTCTITFGEYGVFEKKLVNIDKENKTIDISLKVKNTDPGNHKREETDSESLPGEVVLAIDVSYSMVAPQNSVNGVTRKKLLLDAANDLVDKLFDAKPDIKIGLAKFSSVPDASAGSIEDAKTVLELSSNKSAVKEGLSNIENGTDTGDFTDIDAGLKVAETLLSSDSSTKKYILLLTDGLPNTTSSGKISEYSDATMNETKAELSSIQSKGINLISLLIGVTNDNYPVSIYPQPQSYSKQLSYEELANEIFGTTANPKYGSVYYVNSNKIADTLKNAIYNDLVTTSTIEIDESDKYKLTDIVIKDYFPQNIVDNFTYSVLTQPSLGTVSSEIDSDRSITWSIPELKPGEESSLTYRLTLKDGVDESILNTNLPTNENVTIDYKKGGDPQDQVHNDKSPIVKLTTEADPTIVPDKILPQTGSYMWATVIIVSILGVSLSTFGFIKSKRMFK